MTKNSPGFIHPEDVRRDWMIIESFIKPKSRVLDLGCGDGSLLAILKSKKNIIARGVEISEENIQACIQKGISVFQSDLDEGLRDFSDKSFDYVILSSTIQVVYEPKMLLTEMLRVGKKVIVSIPNFGYYPLRFSLFFKGKTPKSKILPFEWYDTPNIRTLTVDDFKLLCHDTGVRIDKMRHIHSSPSPIAAQLAKLLPNWFSEISIFLLS